MNNRMPKQSPRSFNEGMRRNVQIRPGEAVPPKPQGKPVGAPHIHTEHKDKKD